MLAKAKTLLIITVALWGFVSAYKNISDWEGTIVAVQAATSMSSFPEGATSPLATSSPIIVWSGAIFILLSKLATGILCSIGAKEIALTGCAIAMFMLFMGFVVIAEGWFELWRSEIMRDTVLDSAFRYGGMITLIALFVATKEE